MTGQEYAGHTKYWPYLDAANEGYRRLRLKEGEVVGVVVYSGRGS